MIWRFLADVEPSRKNATYPLLVAMILALPPSFADAEEPNALDMLDLRPSRERLKSAFIDIDREVERLSESGEGAAANALARQRRNFQEQFAQRMPLATSETPELHAVGVYTGLGGGRNHEPGYATVKVSYSAAPVVLSLSAYEPVEWTVEIDKGVRLEKILISGYHPQKVVKAPAKIPVVDLNGNLSGHGPYCYARDAGSYPGLASALKEQTGLELATFLGGYRFPNQPIVVGEENREWLEQEILAAMQPVHEEATKHARELTLARMRKVTFRAAYHPVGEGVPVGAGQAAIPSYGDFTPLGPITATLRPVADRLRHLTPDSEGKLFTRFPAITWSDWGQT